jgi:prepilin-type N-terminal cleavage/methylation domain-containing protein
MWKMRHRSTLELHGAFTLIELLIVVGIIAILAMIALPNFLEAQTRAKVARVKSDLRTVVTGLESYRVDNNTYPTYHYVQNSKSNTGFSFHVGGTFTDVGSSPPFAGPNPITSPVAYLSSFPKDIYGGRGGSDPGEAADFYYVNWDYALDVLPDTSGFHSVFELVRRQQGSWRLHSPGPDQIGPDTDGGSGHEIVYDPSNGTVSGGDLLRTQKGPNT